MKKIGVDLSDGDRAYCIFDTDIEPIKNTVIKEAKKLASLSGIEIITSIPSIELWFLLHYEYTTASMDNKSLINRLKKFYPNYAKNINIFSDINKNINTAIDSAKKLEKHQLENGKIIKDETKEEIYKNDYLERKGFELPFVVKLSQNLILYDLLDKVYFSENEVMNKLWP